MAVLNFESYKQTVAPDLSIGEYAHLQGVNRSSVQAWKSEKYLVLDHTLYSTKRLLSLSSSQPEMAIALSSYISQTYGDDRGKSSRFADDIGANRHQVSTWLTKGYQVIGDRLVSKTRDLKVPLKFVSRRRAVRYSCGRTEIMEVPHLVGSTTHLCEKALRPYLVEILCEHLSQRRSSADVVVTGGRIRNSPGLKHLHARATQPQGFDGALEPEEAAELFWVVTGEIELVKPI